MTARIDIQYEGRRIRCEVTAEGELDLWLEGTLRKRRRIPAGGKAYVWTNVELNWEVHHLIEGRYNRASGWLEVFIHGRLEARERVSERHRTSDSAD